MNAIEHQQEQAKEIKRKLQLLDTPRSMVRIPMQQHPYRVEEAGSASHAGMTLTAMDDRQARYYGTILRAELSTEIAEHYESTDDVRVLHIKQDASGTLTTSLQGRRSRSTLMIHVEAGAKLELTHLLRGEEGLHDLHMELVIEKGAKAQITTIQECEKDTFLRIARAGQVKEEAELSIHDLLLGASYTKLTSHAYLTGKQATAKQSSTLLGDEQRYLITQQSHHLVGDTHSDIKTKGVLANNSRAGFLGLVSIRPQAARSQGYQSMDVLLLDEASRASAIPELAIQTDDVECSHGATIGELDDTNLFYLQSRGIPKEQAKRLVLVGFLMDGVKHLSEAQQDDLRRRIEERL